jgi:hypothetical protein
MLVASVFSSFIAVNGVSAQTATDSVASAVPADTVMYVTVNLDQESDQWTQAMALLERAGLSQLAEDEAGASTEDIGQAVEAQNITGNAAIVFTDAESLMSYSTGDIATMADPAESMDMAMSETPDVPEGFAMVIQPDDPEALAAQFVDMTNGEATDAGATVQTVDYNGVTITYWESTEEGVTGTATAVIDDTVVLATRPSDIEPIIDTVQGTTDTLASAEGFLSVYDSLETDALVFGYMNLDAMMTAVQNDPAALEAIGSDQLVAELEAAKGHVGWSMYASDAGFHMDTVVIPNDPTAMPTGDPFTPGMASKIPADVMVFANSNNFYGTGISEYIGLIMQAGLGQSMDDGSGTPVATPTTGETWGMMEQILGFNPDTDLLANLDGEYAVYAGVYDLESGMPNPEFLFVSETSDAATLTDVTAEITQLATQMNEGNYEVSSRTVDGGEITVVTLPSDSTGSIPVVIEFGVVNGEMLIGVNGAIDKYLAGDGPMLADDANFQNTFANLPSENLLSISYVNIEGQVMPLLDMIVAQMGTSSSTLDNHEDCGNYATQAEAQTAYDADTTGLWLLDMDYDGEACEDFFNQSAPAASPESISSQVSIPSAGAVTWVQDGAYYVSSILVIGDQAP